MFWFVFFFPRSSSVVYPLLSSFRDDDLRSFFLHFFFFFLFFFFFFHRFLFFSVLLILRFVHLVLFFSLVRTPYLSRRIGLCFIYRRFARRSFFIYILYILFFFALSIDTIYLFSFAAFEDRTSENYHVQKTQPIRSCVESKNSAATTRCSCIPVIIFNKSHIRFYAYPPYMDHLYLYIYKYII